MKELSIEQKARRYDEAIERANNLHKDAVEMENNMTTKTCEIIFPELKESEDERIRKALIKYFTLSDDNADYQYCGVPCKDIVAWLEKQGKETSWKPSKEEMDVLYGLAYITNQYDEHKEEVITRLYQDLKREFFNGSSYENMFPNTEDGVRRRSTIQVLEYARSLDAYNQYGKADIDKNIAWLEKQGKQRSDDIDNKFIRMRETKPANIAEFLDRLTTVEQEFLWEHIAKIRELDKEEQKPADIRTTGYWNVQDIEIPFGAKDSELQEASYYIPEGFHAEINGNRVIIKKGEQKPTETVKWSPQEESCICQLESLVKEQWRQAERMHNSVNIKKTSELMFFLKTLNPNKKPADKVEPKFKVGQMIKKEGFNLGFIIVKIEDGFYYNDMGDYFPFTDQDNWELVEQKPVEWSEEDERMYRGLHNLIYSTPYCDSRKELSDWFKSLKDRVQPQPKQEWNYNDEIIIGTIIQEIEKIPSEKFIDNAKYRCLDWLKYRTKSLKPQNTWKPSKKQLEALEHSLGDYNIKVFEDRYEILKSLYKNLKKLREGKL